jgi:chromosome partitioning protein
MNRVPAQGRLPGEIAAELRRRGMTLLDAPVGNRTAFAAAFAAGLGVTEASPRSAAAGEVHALATALKALRRE